MKYLQSDEMGGSIGLMSKIRDWLRNWLGIQALELRVDGFVELHRALLKRIEAIENNRARAKDADIVDLSREIEELRQRVSTVVHNAPVPTRTARNWSEFADAAVAAQLQEKS